MVNTAIIGIIIAAIRERAFDIIFNICQVSACAGIEVDVSAAGVSILNVFIEINAAYKEGIASVSKLTSYKSAVAAGLY